jgi:hypothetical protein
LNNIPTEVQEKIEGRAVEGIKARLNTIKPAPLLADELPLREVGSFFDSAIEHDSITDKIHSSTDQVVESRSSTSEISLNQNSVTERSKFSSTEDSTNSVNVVQVSVSQIGIGQITPTQIGTFQVGISDNRIVQPSFHQGSTKEIGSSKVGSSQVGFTQIGSTQVDIPQNSAFKIDKVPSTFAFSDYDLTVRPFLSEVVTLS